MRRRYRRLVGAACCVGAIGVMAALLLAGQGAGADQNDQGNRPGTGHAKTHGPPSWRGHGNLHPSGAATASAPASAPVAAAAHGSTPAHVAQPTAQPSAWTNPAPHSAVAPVPAAHTTITLQGMQSLPPGSHPVRHPTGQPARIVDVAAAPATPPHDSVVLAATLSGLLFAVGVVVITYGYRPGQRHGRHRSA